MKLERIFLLLSVFCIFTLFIFAEFQKPIIKDKIREIIYGKNSMTILLENNNEKIIILNNTPINNIQTKDRICIYGTREKSINETIIFATKITKCSE